MKLVIPAFKELAFRQSLLADSQTMAYNEKWGGTIDFPKEKWQNWYERWINQEDRFYAYLYSEQENTYIGEAAYHIEKYEDGPEISIIIHEKYRNKGYGKLGLSLLLEKVFEKYEVCYDEIALDNPSLALFLKMGFEIIDQNELAYIVRKTRIDKEK